MSFSFNLGDLNPLEGIGPHGGSAPSPFDALNGPTLAGLEGSHPLHAVTADQLLRPSDGGPVTGTITLDGPARVGDGITGTITLTATTAINARSAALRLVGLRLDEVQRSRDNHDSKGNVTSTERWVECQGKLFSDDAFVDPVIPATMEAGATWSGPFQIPAPPLGPPSAHLGESIVAWAIEVRWDVAMGSDHFVAMFLPLAQHPDLLRAGVGQQGGNSMLAEMSVAGGSIAITSPLPVPAGSDLVVKVTWPSASGGQQARIELHRRTNAPNGVEGIIATVAVAAADLTSGAAEAHLTVPAGSAPSFDGAGLQVNYVIRVLVDRRFRPDAAIERPIAIT
jgi:hypothetical protein